MKIAFGVLALLFIAVLFVGAKKGREAKTDQKRNPEIGKNPYQDLRGMILKIKAKDLGIDETKNPVWSCLMEMGFESGSASLAMVADGAVSMYTSTGGGTIGAGEHESVRAPAQKYLISAEQYLGKMEKTNVFPTPKDGEVIFYVVTKEGVFFHLDKEEDLGNNKSEFSNLFYLGQDVLTAMRPLNER